MQILMVITSNDKLGNTGEKTGVWLEELAAPYFIFKDAGHKVTLASPLGGLPPIDPRSLEDKSQTRATHRFLEDAGARTAFASTLQLGTIKAGDYDAVFYPGGHGPLWDLAVDQDSIKLIEEMAATGKPVAAVCHGPAALVHAVGPDGKPLVHGKKVTGYSDSEEKAVGLQTAVPFLLEDMLKAKGGKYSHEGDFESHVVTDGLLVTGQNPASSTATAEALLGLLKKWQPREQGGCPYQASLR